MTGSIDIYPKPQSCVSPLNSGFFSDYVFSEKMYGFLLPFKPSFSLHQSAIISQI